MAIRRSPVEAVLTATVAALKASTGLTPLVTGVFNDVPQGTAYPYVVVTAPTNRRQDTWGCLGSAALIDVKAVSQYRGDREAERILDQCIRTLNFEELSMSGHRMLGLAWDSSDRFQDVVNGVPTRYHVATLRAWTEQI